MKIISQLLLYVLLWQTIFAQANVTAYYYSNPYLYPSVSPSYYPTIVGNSRINIVVPATYDLGDVKFPGLSITAANITSPTLIDLESYLDYSSELSLDPDIVGANHNYIVGKIENDILTGKIADGCRGVARITTSAAKKWLLGFCPVAETPPTLVACSIGVALQNAVVLKVSQRIVKKGCTVTVKYVSDEIIELTFETTRELERSIEEAKFWWSFINSVDGMIWLMNRLQQ